jgi:hypothetical protein
LAIAGRPFLVVLRSRKYYPPEGSATPYDPGVRLLRRILLLAAGAAGLLLYVWFAAVRAVPGVKRRKAAIREARRRGPRS